MLNSFVRHKAILIEALQSLFHGPAISSREARARVQPGSLLRYKCDIYSQRGDDGIIREIFRRLNIQTGVFIEFGAWDGVYLSNTRLLFEEGWSGVFIEGDTRKAAQLGRNYRDYPDIKCIESFVLPESGTGGRTLDQICDAEKIDHIDFLSIDVDGLDLNIFESLRRRPTCVAIEGGFSWHPELSIRVPDEIAGLNLQQPLAVAIDAVKQKGYAPLCFNQNLYCIDQQFAHLFPTFRTDAVSLWLDAYYDQSLAFRIANFEMRRLNRNICKFESPYRGKFTISLSV